MLGGCFALLGNGEEFCFCIYLFRLPLVVCMFELIDEYLNPMIYEVA